MNAGDDNWHWERLEQEVCERSVFSMGSITPQRGQRHGITHPIFSSNASFPI
jgi:hypothetical protein